MTEGNPLAGIEGQSRWVGWAYEGGRKVPKSPGGGNARSNDPSTWGTAAEARAAAEEGGMDGVGVMLSDGLTGIDLDGCVHDGVIDPWAQEIIDRIGSYAEISPSGTGVHILCYADPEEVGAIGRADHGRGIEVYNHGRYFTVTGDAVNDKGVEDRTKELGGFVSDEFPGESPDGAVARGAGRLARDQVARRANETVIHNVGRDRARGARFARVPMGAEPCAFCTMLASRGFVYHTEETAGEFNHFHSSCRCKVVPGFPTMERYVKNGVKVSRGLDPSVEGYDPDRYYDAYRHPEKYTSESEAHDYVRQSQHGQLRSNGDPAKEYYGPITDEQRNDFESECRRLGVEIMDVGSEELEDIAYGPRVGDYPPQIRIPRDASYLAHMHELDHAKADAENGQLTMIYYLLHPEVRIDMEKRAYGIEIERARADGYSELAERLEGNLAKEIENIESGSR